MSILKGLKSSHWWKLTNQSNVMLSPNLPHCAVHYIFLHLYKVKMKGDGLPLALDPPPLDGCRGSALLERTTIYLSSLLLVTHSSHNCAS